MFQVVFLALQSVRLRGRTDYTWEGEDRTDCRGLWSQRLNLRYQSKLKSYTTGPIMSHHGISLVSSPVVPGADSSRALGSPAGPCLAPEWLRTLVLSCWGFLNSVGLSLDSPHRSCSLRIFQLGPTGSGYRPEFVVGTVLYDKYPHPARKKCQSMFRHLYSSLILPCS